MKEWKKQHDYVLQSLLSKTAPVNEAGDLSLVTKDKPEKKSKFIRVMRSINPFAKKRE